MDEWQIKQVHLLVVELWRVIFQRCEFIEVLEYLAQGFNVICIGRLPIIGDGCATNVQGSEGNMIELYGAVYGVESYLIICNNNTRGQIALH